MPRLIWTPAALQDVSRLHRFLKSKNPLAASRAVAAIRAGAGLLGEHAQAGKPFADMPEMYRVWPVPFGVSGYLILYRLNADGSVAVLAVRHMREAGF